jgi:hypothetical protein
MANRVRLDSMQPNDGLGGHADDAMQLGSLPTSNSCAQKPLAAHVSSVQMSPSSGHGRPGVSATHDCEQQSPSSLLLSSHC